MIGRATPANRTGRTVIVLLVLWFSVAVGVGLSGVYYRVPAPVIGATNATLITLTLLAVFFVRPLQAWVMTAPLYVFVLYHAVRFVGIAFLMLYADGAIPGDFAITAGWGDIAVAVTALVVAVAALPITGRGRWWTVFLWNAFGLLDILMVLGTGIRLGMRDSNRWCGLRSFR